MLGCLSVTRISSTLLFILRSGTFFSHSFYTSCGRFSCFPCSRFCKKVSHTCLKFIGLQRALRLWQLFTHSLGLWKRFVPVSRRG